MLLVQFSDPAGRPRAGILEQNSIRILDGYDTVYGLAQAAIAAKGSLSGLAAAAAGSATADYDAVLAAGRLLPPLTHPDPAHCYVTGTGLTHLGSADTRDGMHKKVGGDFEALSDSMKMFRLGLEGGKPDGGAAGVAPEWFYKGDGASVVTSGQALTMPDFSLDGGEETEIAGLYLVGPDGQPYRVGYALGNEFSDHVLERQNYLYLAHSKLRACALGPAVLVGELPAHIAGSSRVYDRAGRIRWEKPFLSGEANMSHTIANLEYHHFKYAQFRRPGDVHVHFFGAATLSFADGVLVQPGETFEIEAPGFGPPLSNQLAVAETKPARVIAL